MISTKQGSQFWLRRAVNEAPDVLLDVLRPAIGLDSSVQIEWCSPLADEFQEYRDMEALQKLGIKSLPVRELSSFWPKGGPVWDALGKTSDGQFIFVEAKAHVAEVESPPSGAKSSTSIDLIQKSLQEAREHFAPQSPKPWGETYYQYANRLAHHYWFRNINGLRSHMVFLYFLNAPDMNGPRTEAEWSGAIAKCHSALGITQIEREGVHEIFLDVARLQTPVSPETTH